MAEKKFFRARNILIIIISIILLVASVAGITIFLKDKGEAEAAEQDLIDKLPVAGDNEENNENDGEKQEEEITPGTQGANGNSVASGTTGRSSQSGTLTEEEILAGITETVVEQERKVYEDLKLSWTTISIPTIKASMGIYKPELQIEKTATGLIKAENPDEAIEINSENVPMVRPGDVIIYTIKVSNIGNYKATNVTITEALDVMFDGKEIKAGEPLVTLETLESGKVAILKVAYVVTEEDIAEEKNIKNTAYVVDGNIEEQDEDYIIPVNPDIADITGTKTWDDVDNQDGKRPESITVNLLANGEKVQSKQVKETDSWKWTFSNLPKYAEDGTVIEYTISEEAVDNYTTTINGYNITNTHTPETVEVSGSKTWEDNDDQDGIRPTSITINLLADGEKVDSATVSEDNEGKWKWEFKDFPKYEEGREIVYTIEEEAVTGYTTEVSGYNVTNIHTPETISASGHKTWEDNSDQDGIRPDSITINLLADGQQVDSKTVTKLDRWEWNFSGLPKYEAGREIGYTIAEDTVTGYSTQVNGYNVTNTHTPETITVSGSKTWEDNDDQDGIRPDSITITLFANGEFKARKTVTEADNWSWTFAGLPKYEEGREITYTIAEDPVSGYSTEVSGYNITNTHATETTSVSGTKTWNDNENQDGIRPDSITIKLLADGTEVESKTVTETDNWSWTFTGLPKYEDGEIITYTITEDPVSGYSTEVSGYNVTNTYTTDVTVTKVWEDEAYQGRPDSIEIQLYKKLEGETTPTSMGTDYKVALSVGEDEKWDTADLTHTWNNLPKYDANGNEITYTVQEVNVPNGYQAVYSDDTFTITNVLKSATVSVTVYKEWVTPHVMTHPDIHIQLYQIVDEKYEKYGDLITLSATTTGEADVWEQDDLTYTWYNLPKYKLNNGELVIENGVVQLNKYTVKEVDVDEKVENLIQYITTYSDDTMSLDEQEIIPDKTITNTAKGIVETVTYKDGIEKYNKPVDVVLVLDISGSMAEANSQGNSKAKDMVTAVNETITTIMKHNPLSKVAVVTYSSNVTTILPLGRYEALTTDNSEPNNPIGHYLTCSQGSWNSYSGKYSNVSISTNIKDFNNKQYSVTGATYIQGGIAQGANILSGADTVYAPVGAPETTRIPVLILLSDGEPTQCTESYANVGNPTDTDGDSNATLDDAYYTILTANTYKEKIKENYGVANFYTIGYGADTLLLRTVLNPDKANIDECKVSKNNSKTKKLYDELAKTTAGAYGYNYAKASYTSGTMSATELSSLLNHFIHSSIPSTEYRIFTRDEIEKGKVYLDNIDTTDGFSLTYGDKTYLSLDATKKDGNEWLVKKDTTNNKLYLDLKAVYMDLYGFTSEEQLQNVAVSEQIYVKYHENRPST